MAAGKAELISELRKRVAQLPPLPDEPDFSTSEETLIRYLKSRDWKLEEAARLLIDSIEYRRRTRPQIMDCSWCHNRPGYHSMRQVGHDEAGRPVVYANFAQSASHKNNIDDAVAHVTYLIENAKRTMGPGVSTWIFVFDCTGMTLSSCNPKLGYGVTSVLSNHYPERLGMMVCLNHSPVFHGVWKAMKQFLHPNTSAKVKMVRSKAKTVELFAQLFNAELSAWLQEEIALNRQNPLSKSQVEFWNPPAQDSNAHDPRGCRSYITKYVETCPKFCQSNCVSEHATPSAEEATFGADEASSSGTIRAHKPHPNIVDQLSGHKLERVILSKEEELERQQAQKMVETEAQQRGAPAEGEEEEIACDLEIPSDLQIPSAALPIGTST